MKKLLFIFVSLFSGILAAQVQTVDTLQKKEVNSANNRSSEFDEQLSLIGQILESKSFVFEANSVISSGIRQDVSQNINFVKVDSTQATVQSGQDSGSGSNGVGGFTLKGSISNWTLNKDEKRGSFSLRLSVLSYGGNCDVLMNINALGVASVTISGNNFYRIAYQGKIVKLEESIIYVGRHL